MGFLSKLFGGDADKEKAALDLLKSIMGGAQENKPAQEEKKEAEAETPAEPKANQSSYSGPSGFSWGDEMPEEENQYSVGGPFWLYFEKIFGSEFADLRYEKNVITDYKRIAYSFYKAGAKVLVVELMSDSSSAKKLRNECKKEGVPYLRFYIDHDGWWNTRSYVVGRMKKALNV
ncbi:MAG: hypothetical protein IKX86_02720 [Clostridia bacterium]|nr:hypothetical protein [Clostridia bacterium]